jgi:N-acetylglucosaminyl-diphospho-decaprenol L-rhamnosyltransferase
MAGSPAGPDLSVVVVTWNSAPVVQGCLGSLRAAAGDLVYELVVVDNASSDGTVELVRGAAPDATVIVNATNRGLAAANNQGMSRSGAPLVLICNPDVIFEPGSVAAMVGALRRIPAAGWVVPQLLHEDGTAHESAGELPRLGDALLGRQWSRRRQTGFWSSGPTIGEARVGRGHEAAYIVRRAAIDEVGPQDERFVLDWEGIDWSERFARRGWQTWIVPSARVVHLGGASIRQVPFRWVVLQHKGMYLYFSTRRPALWKPVLMVAFGARAVLKLTLTAIRLPMYELAHRSAS